MGLSTGSVPSRCLISPHADLWSLDFYARISLKSLLKWKTKIILIWRECFWVSFTWKRRWGTSILIGFNIAVGVTSPSRDVPESKVHGSNMGPTWGRQDPGGPPCWPHVPCYQGCDQCISIKNEYTCLCSSIFIYITCKCITKKQFVNIHQYLKFN